MALNCDYIKSQLINSAFMALNMWSPEAVTLGLLTIANESDFGTYRKQIGGSALSICQIEQNTFNDIVRYLNTRDDLLQVILTLTKQSRLPDFSYLANSQADLLSVALMRIKYYMIPTPIPPENDIIAIANYYKTYYNTAQGQANVTTAVEKYTQYVTC